MVLSNASSVTLQTLVGVFLAFEHISMQAQQLGCMQLPPLIHMLDECTMQCKGKHDVEVLLTDMRRRQAPAFSAVL